ncbi:BofC C-terminal domain-containing protein [Neobacillus sp. LXY-4]|uniref:BofC C-terminal domain-containing protein n=1 Tax=Neobacillus sp. LXY-4 TaxID=3379826 RepID=UPI003EE2F0C3
MNARMSVLITAAASFQLLFCDGLTGSAEEKVVTRHEAEIQETRVQTLIILQRVYLDGDISEEYITETSKTIPEIKEKYKQWQFVSQQGQVLKFRYPMDDISPLLKANGYFGITEEGILTIFNGKPKNSKVIHSFFQIDVGKLESRKKQQLIKGIPIKTKDRYHQVLETFKPYSVEEWN